MPAAMLAFEPHKNQPLTQLIDRISALPFVKATVSLPDLHLKSGTEAPSSFAVVTQDAIVPHFSSSTLNCGMALAKTRLTVDDFNQSTISKLFRSMCYSRANIVQRRLKVYWDHDPYRLNRHELDQACRFGAAALLDKLNFPTSILDAIETQGRWDYPLDITQEDVDAIVPLWVKRASYDLGLGFHGNHFLEVQTVEKIFDNSWAQQFGLHAGQVTIMSHNGGGNLPSYLGQIYSKRLKTAEQPYRLRSKIQRSRWLHHFGNLRSLQQAKERYRCYFSGQPFVATTPDSTEWARLLRYVGIAMNYGYAFRLLTHARLRDFLMDAWGQEKGQCDLLWQVSHNSIQFEQHHGNGFWVHRHNACRLLPQKPVIISGWSNVASYVCVPGPKAASHYFTVDHGGGELIKDALANGKSRVLTDRCTERWRIKYALPTYEEKIEHLEHRSAEGIEALVQHLSEQGVLIPVAVLRPLATLKN